jgi:hypothetical protein
MHSAMFADACVMKYVGGFMLVFVYQYEYGYMWVCMCVCVIIHQLYNYYYHTSIIHSFHSFSVKTCIQLIIIHTFMHSYHS